MKRRLRTMLVLFPVIMLFCTMRVSAASVQQQIFDFCTGKMGMNSAAACGVLANIQKESNFNPTASCIDSNGLTSYGLCQWNGDRFTELKNFCSTNGYSYTSVDGQLNYLKYELENTEVNAYSKIKNVENSENGAYTAGYNWARYFERCAQYWDGVDQYVARGNLSKNTYWPTYGLTAPTNLKITTNKSSYTLGETMTITPSATNANQYGVSVWLGDFSTGTRVFYKWNFTGSVSYTPSQSGTYTIAVDAVNSAGTISARKTVSVINNTYSVVYYDENGDSLWTEDATAGTEYTLRSDYPKVDGKYFCGWTYTNGNASYDVRPGEKITVSNEVNLYPVYVTHKEAISGNEVEIFNIEDFTAPDYEIQRVEHKTENKIDTSYWTNWSDYGLDAVTASSTVQVRTTPMYRYYYYLCPSCNRHEPFWGTSDCGAQIPKDAWHEKWSTTPYSQSAYKTFSYTTAKYYTTSLGDGQLWCFSSGNVNATTAGTVDAGGTAIVIKTGYSFRRYVAQYNVETITTVSYKITPKSVALDRWHKVDGTWYYYQNGAPVTGWEKISGTWYYFNSSGVMQTGWQSINGNWYYLSGSGAMQTGWLLRGSNYYYLNSSGVMQTGWTKVGQNWYYMNSSGIMQTGWLQQGKNWYFLNDTGYMQTGWLKRGSNYYYMNSSGVMQTGWIKVGKHWYFMNSSGLMQTGWLQQGANWYFLNDTGYMQTGWLQRGTNWYYFESSGKMVTGDYTINGTVYHFNSSGAWIQ